MNNEIEKDELDDFIETVGTEYDEEKIIQAMENRKFWESNISYKFSSEKDTASLSHFQSLKHYSKMCK